jgi:cyanophycinase-like exopeptidase
MVASESTQQSSPGPVVLFGSGETSPAGRKVFDALFQKLPPSPKVALLETPAGFELNSAQVIGRVADFLNHSLQNYNPQMAVIPARKRGTAFSPDDPDLVAPLLDADLIFMGPGSPTYAVRQLQDSLAWQMIMARHRLGATLVMASAATIAVSAHALPVYEIYKVGEDLHWKKGLDFFSLYGFPLVFIPHWNNNDGGDELDTSRCFMGQPRFAHLMEMLPADLTVFGIDEKTALVMDMQSGICQVKGLGGVRLIHTDHEQMGDQSHKSSVPTGDLTKSELLEVARKREGHVHSFPSGQEFKLGECCPFVMPYGGEGLRADVWTQAVDVRRQASEIPAPGTPREVLELANARQQARTQKDWVRADQLRDQILALGWEVKDTPDGPQVGPRE